MAAKRSKRTDMFHQPKSTVLEGPPPDRTREPGEFRGDYRRGQKIMADLRAFKAAVVAERKGVSHGDR
jgi:hypothetical protein